MAAVAGHRLSVDERRAAGRDARTLVPRPTQADWEPATDRPDPVGLLVDQDAAREPDLVPVRHGRMAMSPLAFYRGAARIMATDLKDTPRAGLEVQLCGDAHLSNFGVFASPERTLVFDVNDFDETLRGPFEYDVKRLATSFVVAARANGMSDAENNVVTTTVVTAYRHAMRSFAEMGTLAVWYAQLPAQRILEVARGLATKPRQRRELREGEKELQKAQTRDSLQALSKLCETGGDRYRIVSRPPLVVPLRDIARTDGFDPVEVEKALRKVFAAYRTTLDAERRELLQRFVLVDVARKVVGVGSVGTRDYIALLEGRDRQDPLFLQVKEATASVLEEHLPPSRYRNHGERVVRGQRLMQAASDIFLGWTMGPGDGRHYYWRQLRDMKGSVPVDQLSLDGLTVYAEACGWTLARAHARSGDPVAIATYLGKRDSFDRAVAGFAHRYADQNQRDYEAFVDAIRSGAIAAVEGV